jgi:hypothetical protein
MYNQWTSPNAVARATMNNPLSNPMIGGGPGYGGGLNRAMSGMPGAVGYASNPGIPGVSLHVGAPFSSRAWMQSVGSVGGPVHNPGIPGVPLTVAPPPSVADWMQRVATGPARYANPTGNPCKEGYVECGSGVNKSCCSIAMGGCDDPLCGVAEMQARRGGTTPTRGALGFAAAGRRGAPLGGGRHGSPQSYSDACTHNDDCGPLETCVNGVCTQVKPQGRAGYQSGGGQARGCKPPSKGCGTGRKWSKELCKCVNLPISLPPDTGAPLGRPGGGGGVRGRPKPNCPTGTHRCGSFCCKNLQATGQGGVARTVKGRRGGAVTQAIVSNPARRGYAVRSMVSARPQQARGFFCRLFPNSPRCSSISAAPHAGCRWNVTTQTWHCPSEGQQAGPQLSAGRRRNPGVVPVGVYPQWSGSAAHNRGTIAKAINPDACCDGCAISGGSCGGGCGCKGKCDGSCSGAHRHHNP